MDSESDSKLSSNSFELLDSEETSCEPIAIDYLITAIHQGDYSKCAKIINDGIDVNSRDSQGLTPLHWAAINNRLDTIKLLVSCGADVNSMGGNPSATPIHWAIKHGCQKVVIYFVANCSVDLTLLTSEGYNCLHLATILRDSILMTYFLEKGLKVDSVGKNGFTALHLACSHCGSSDIINLLLGYGANVNLTDSVDGNTPLHLVATYCNYSAVEVFFAHGKCHLLGTNIKGQTVLQLAEETNDVKFFIYVKEKFISQGVIAADFSQRFPLNLNTRKVVSLAIPPVTFVLVTIALASLDSFFLRFVFVSLTLSNSYHFKSVFCANIEVNQYFLKSLFYSSCVTNLIMWLIIDSYIYPVNTFNLIIHLLCFMGVAILIVLTTRKSDIGVKLRTQSLLHLIETNKIDNKSLCTICLRRKAQGMEHCHICNHCVPRFEGHCVWLGTDLGYTNRRFYIVLLGLLSFWYTFSLISGIIVGLRVSKPHFFGFIQGFFIVDYPIFNVVVISAFASVYFGFTTMRMVKQILYGYDIHHFRKRNLNRPTCNKVLQNLSDFSEMKIFDIKPNYVDWTIYYGEEEYVV